MRHIVILDFRPDSSESHIRNSICVTLDSYRDKLVEAIAGPKEIQQKYKSQFEGDDIKRVLFVLPVENWKEYETKINQEIAILNEEVLLKGFLIRLSKAYFLKDFIEFRGKYPFLCVNEGSTE